uniref:Ig-like domain-containing protein n=1 Tax=Oryzias latipes TaxID=8090 RepID=A0A3B3I876_ORYLA
TPPRLFTSICCTFFCVSLSGQIQQYPAEMYIRSGNQADIGCSHSIDSYNRILWYRQESGALQLLGYMYAGSPNSEGAVTIAGGSSKGENCTLTTETLHSPGSAVYFCAASFHSAAGPSRRCDKRKPTLVTKIRHQNASIWMYIPK